jgi:hypothetical protein
MKPFLIGFVTAVLLFSIGTLSSIYTLCSPVDVHSSTMIVYGDGNYTTKSRASICHSSHALGAMKEKEISGEIALNKRSLKWREAVPFLSFHVPKKKKRIHKHQQKEHLIVDDKEEIVLQCRLDPQTCFCHLIWESLGLSTKGYNSKNTIESEKINPLASEQECQQQPQSLKRFPTAFTPEILNLSLREERLVQMMGKNVLEKVLNFTQRSSLVPWGGPPPAATAVSFEWYARKRTYQGANAPLDRIDGGNLFSSYLRIMKWPENLSETDFPFKLCKAKKKVEGKGCETSVAIQHSLEFRERYRPWLVTPGIKSANTNGLVYIRGFSPPFSEREDGGHAIVWLRLALKVKTDEENDRIFFVRSMIREFDRAVAASLQRSSGRVGKFNAVVDGEGFTWSSMPSLSSVKALVAILQDHYADRLGVVILVNVGSICEILLKIFLPLITEEVRNKIVVLPHGQKERLKALNAVLGTKENIPERLGGIDDYNFDSDEYYSDDIFGHDEEALQFLTTMPYHA